VSLALFGGDDIAPFLVFTAIAGGAAFFLGFGLLHVFSPLEFTVAVAYVMGIGLALVGGIRAILASRKGSEGPTPTEQRLPKVMVGIVGAAAVISLFGFIFTRQEVSDADAAGATVIEMTGFEFEPESSTATTGSKLLITNSDPFVHDFTLEEYGIAEDVGPRGEVLVDLTGVAPGTYEYVCSLHFDGTSGMTGTLIVGS
jgi:plastocyanin